MKKLLFFIIICIFQQNYAMEVVKPLHEQFRTNFKNLSQKKYNESIGYNLILQLWKDKRENVVHTFPSLLAHGFGSSSTTMIEYARVNGSYRIPGDAVTFRFKDAFTNSGSFILHSSFGQINDIKSFLVALRVMYDCKITGCNLFGQSRGGATIPNALAVLNTEIDQWDTGFDAIKSFFAGDDRTKIIEMIKKGVVVLDTPMITSQAGINAHVNRFFFGFVGVEKCVSFLVDRVILPIITCGNYRSSGPQALTSIKNLPMDLKVVVSYQKNDASVGNVHDKEFAKALVNHLGQQNVWIILGNDGGKRFDDITWQELNLANDNGNIQKRFWIIGLLYRTVPAHNAGFFLLFQSWVINKLFSDYGGSYLKDTTKFEQARIILDKSQPDNLDDYFNAENYDMHKKDKKYNIINNLKGDKSRFLGRHHIIGFMTILFNFLLYIKQVA